MNRKQMEALTDLTGGKTRFHCSMADFTTFRTGGTIAALSQIEKVEDLPDLVRFLQEERIRWFVLGRGSNLLVRDGNLPLVAIRLTGSFCTIQQEESGEPRITAGSGASLAQLLDFCRKRGFSGAEFLAGIPGTVGGASIMNAGAFGREIGELIRWVELIDPAGDLVELERRDLSFRYRKLETAKGSIITRIRVGVEKSTRAEVASRMGDYLERRKKMQPLGYPSAGSIFKNPFGDSAGRLLEEAGLKGKKCGGAMISPKHANWIVNTGGATAQDILDLIDLARGKVREKTGIELELEIRVIDQ